MEDLLAIELIRFLQKSKRSVPDDISVIAVDDIILSKMIYPGLTTVALDKEKIGTTAIDILMNLINHNNAKSDVVTSNNLVVRESVRNCNEI